VGRPRHASRQIDAVLAALAAEPERWVFGYELSKRLGIGSGTLYPALIRLSDDGLLEHRWEPSAGRPPRHQYRLTVSGIARASTVAARRSPGQPLSAAAFHGGPA
jgi:PadR family transcriptional regulator PadR